MTRVLLDTCSLLWLGGDRSRLSQRAGEIVNDNAIALHVSAASAWEIGIAARKGRITLSTEPRVWFLDTCRSHDLRVQRLSWRTMLHSAMLPEIHGDPADRMIVATALYLDAPILTPDQVIPRYPGVTTIW